MSVTRRWVFPSGNLWRPPPAFHAITTGVYDRAVFHQWAGLAERAIEALERIARAAERIAISLEAAEPEWRRKDELKDKEEILTRG